MLIVILKRLIERVVAVSFEMNKINLKLKVYSAVVGKIWTCLESKLVRQRYECNTDIVLSYDASGG